MTANPYQAPGTVVRDRSPLPWPAHARSLWGGVLLASLAPVVLVALPMIFFSGGPIPPAGVAIFCLMVLVFTGTVTVLFGLPMVLLLRWIRQLRGAWVCLLAMLAGMGVGIGVMTLDQAMDVDEGTLSASELAVRGALLGAASGLASGLGMVFGAGIPFRRLTPSEVRSDSLEASA